MSRRELLLLNALSWDTGFFPAFELELHRLSWVSSLLTTDLGTSQPPNWLMYNYVSQFLVINLLIYTDSS